MEAEAPSKRQRSERAPPSTPTSRPPGASQRAAPDGQPGQHILELNALKAHLAEATIERVKLKRELELLADLAQSLKSANARLLQEQQQQQQDAKLDRQRQRQRSRHRHAGESGRQPQPQSDAATAEVDRDGWPAGPEDVRSPVPNQPAGHRRLPLAAAAAPLPPPAPLPPLPRLDPSRLLLEADPGRPGFSQSDIATVVLHFRSQLRTICSRSDVLHAASGLINAATAFAIPQDTDGSIPPGALEAAAPEFLGHMVTAWMSHRLWNEPLRFLLGCGRCAALGVLDLPPPPPPSGRDGGGGGGDDAADDGGNGDDVIAQRNLRTLLCSQAACRWLPYVRDAARVLHMETQTRPQRNAVDMRQLLMLLPPPQQQKQGRGCSGGEGVAAGGGDAGGGGASSSAVTVLLALETALSELTDWLEPHPALVELLRADGPFQALLLRALHLGLLVRAVHPLLRLFTAPPRAVTRLQQQHQFQTLDAATQNDAWTVKLVPRGPAAASGEGGDGGKFVLCSVKPGVEYDMQAAAAAGVPLVDSPGGGAGPPEHDAEAAAVAGAGDRGGSCESGARWVLVREEVVVWEWARPSGAAAGGGHGGGR